MRQLAFLASLLFFIGCSSPEQIGEPQAHQGTEALWNEDLEPFYHGVASGDPLPDRVILWTRVTPRQAEAVEASWEISADEAFSEIAASGTYTTGPQRDFTVKVDATGLEAGTRYFYRFQALGQYSPVGQTRTARAGEVDQLRFAVVSCSNYEAGYFNALADIATREDLDAVLHLGDYIYEYGPGYYGDTSLQRKHLPPHEIITLEDYRTRYAQYRLDPDFQAAHRNHPFITIWDDHEITNNSYQSGAQNHQPEEGDYEQRKAAARQAYYEWLPVRAQPGDRLYRSFHFGELADLIMLDERLAGRSPQAESMAQEDYRSPDRSMLGVAQREWLFEELSASEARWKIIGNQVIFSDLDLSMFRPQSPRNLDAWDGYPAEKEQILSFLRSEDLQNVVFITGDTHASWAFEVPSSIADYQRRPASARLAVEFGTPSISSANWDEGRSLDTVLRAERVFLESGHNPHLKDVNLHDHGYLLLELQPDRALVEWRFVEQLDTPNKAMRPGSRLMVRAGTHRIEIPEAVQ